MAADSVACIDISWIRELVVTFWSKSSWIGTQLFFVTVLILYILEFQGIGDLMTSDLAIFLPKEFWRNILYRFYWRYEKDLEIALESIIGEDSVLDEVYPITLVKNK
jgi:hypothetical protein